MTVKRTGSDGVCVRPVSNGDGGKPESTRPIARCSESSNWKTQNKILPQVTFILLAISLQPPMAESLGKKPISGLEGY